MRNRTGTKRAGAVRTTTTAAALASVVVAVVVAIAFAETEPGGSGAEPALRDSIASAPADTCAGRVHVYYFHRTIRCQTCLNFEAYTLEVLNTGFAEQMDRGSIAWSVLNIDDESNAELVDAYDVFESSLVVSIVESGKERSWEKLEAIWGLVQHKPAFMDYVSAEVDSALTTARKETRDEGESALPVHGELVP